MIENRTSIDPTKITYGSLVQISQYDDVSVVYIDVKQSSTNMNNDDDDSIEIDEVKPPIDDSVIIVEVKPQKLQRIVKNEDTNELDKQRSSPKVNLNQVAIRFFSAGKIMAKDTEAATLLRPNKIMKCKKHKLFINK